eukprot:scaffold16746_cov137-Isochrysis_galbana.AAC.5
MSAACAAARLPRPGMLWSGVVTWRSNSAAGSLRSPLAWSSSSNTSESAPGSGSVSLGGPQARSTR